MNNSLTGQDDMSSHAAAGSIAAYHAGAVIIGCSERLNPSCIHDHDLGVHHIRITTW